jgi:hypothetical protein
MLLCENIRGWVRRKKIHPRRKKMDSDLLSLSLSLTRGVCGCDLPFGTASIGGDYDYL